MLHRVIVLKRAKLQFQDTCNYLDSEFGTRIGDYFIDETERCIARLVRYPESGHLEPISDKEVYRSKIIGEYTKMFYTIHGNTLYVAAFVDMRMSPENIKKAVSGK